ncbi:MAG TPA: HAMP domain-containing sensor histidine kinase [Puia sp.]|nr:HAMP domain-containing sensor histidine kinase [Puia sp.]
MNGVMKGFFRFHLKLRNFGYSPSLNGHEKRKLGIFNLMNFFGLLIGVAIPIMGWSKGYFLSAFAWWVAFIPALISLTALICNSFRKYELARMCFFTLYPLLITWIYALKMDIGTDFFFIAFGVVSVFFLQSIYNIIFSFSLSMTCYFLAHAIWNDCEYKLETVNYSLYQSSHLLAIFFIFYGLFLIRNENVRHQLQILNKNRQLRRSNGKIQLQKKDLVELNYLKNKLFSVVAHDLRGPVHALHALFKNMQRYDLPGDEIKTLLPDVVKDISSTCGQMENLLHWVKSQMQEECVEPQVIEISKIITEVLQFLHLQVMAKRIHIRSRIEKPAYISGDKEMVNLVLRNLISNAIKFTPEEGTITLDAREESSYIEIFVEDTGVGIRPETLQQLIEDVHYTTPGTANESGTGLGLMLCKEFLSRNGGRLNIHSEPGKGSIFSFTLPKGIVNS